MKTIHRNASQEDRDAARREHFRTGETLTILNDDGSVHSQLVQPKAVKEQCVTCEAKESLLDASNITGLDTIGGSCPVQGEGTVDGLYWYFRARGERWSFEVWDVSFGPFGELPGKPELWLTGAAWDEEGEYGAGYMPVQEAERLIRLAIAAGRVCNWGRKTKS